MKIIELIKVDGSYVVVKEAVGTLLKRKQSNEDGGEVSNESN